MLKRREKDVQYEQNLFEEGVHRNNEFIEADYELFLKKELKNLTNINELKERTFPGLDEQNHIAEIEFDVVDK